MSEEITEEEIMSNNKNVNIGLVGMFLSIFFITGGLYCWLYMFGFIIPGGILITGTMMVWSIFSLIWVGYWCNKK